MIILHILLWILKIIGILLLVILGLLVLGVLTVLFVPVRYEGKLSGDISCREKAEGYLRISYFLRLIQFKMQYVNGKLAWETRIAWKRFGQDKETDTSENTAQKADPEPAMLPEKPLEKEKHEQKKEEQPVIRTSEKETKTSEKEKKKDPAKPKFFDKIQYTFHKICDRIKSLEEKKDKVSEFLSDEVHRRAFSKGKRVFITFLKAWRPKFVRGNIEFGFDDPYYTGKTLAYLAMIYPFFGEWLEIVPDFEKAVLKGNLHIKGHIRMNHAAAAGIKLILDKNIRSIVKEILSMRKSPKQKKEEKSNGRK
ncbi:MAG: DUF2953 domain-containing protein [Sellimonas sp.]|uniref:DUF2953 domain-containing protein n=1 Tax=Sellimonas sp. TaxID=2021466 RepID=UPI0039A3BD57